MLTPGPLFEPLENRTLLDGNVEVDIRGGALMIYGDAESNRISVANVGATYTISSLDGLTTIEGGALRIFLGVTRGVVFKGGGGDDRMEMPDASVQGPVTLDGGEGSNSLAIDNAEVRGNVKVTGRTGSDQVSMNGTEVFGSVSVISRGGAAAMFVATQVTGKVTVRSGGGLMGVSITEASTVASLSASGRDRSAININNSSVSGNIASASGNGLDAIAISNGSTVSGNVSLNNRHGGSIIDILASTISGSTVVRNGDGEDTVRVSSMVAGKCQIDDGRGNSYINFNDGADIRGSATVKSREGEQTLSINAGADVTDGLKCQLGNGEVTMVIREDITGDVSITGSGNTGWIALDVALCIFSGRLTIKSAIRLQASFYHTTAMGAVSVTGGNRKDDIMIENCQFDNAVSISTGGNDDMLLIEQVDVPLAMPTWFRGRFFASLGSGDDTLIVGAEGIATQRCVFQGPASWDGGGQMTEDECHVNSLNTFAVPLLSRGFEVED